MKWRSWILTGLLLAPLAAAADDSRDGGRSGPSRPSRGTTPSLEGGGRAASGTAAGTVYVTDTLRVGLRAAPDGAVVKSMESGTALEVLERNDRFVRVRDKAGTEGWLEARYVNPEIPARVQLARVREELNKVRARLAEAQAQPKDAEAAPAPVPAPIEPAAESEPALWFFVALGTLVFGFVAGVLWHRESIRRRMGGMYLRI